MAPVPTVLLPLALLLAGTGQTLPVSPPVQAPALPTDSIQPPAAGETTSTVDLTDVEERMTVPVQIAGAGPYRFVIDTGSERTVISRELAGTLGLAEGGPINVTAMSGTSRVGTVIIPSIQVSDVPDIGAIHAPALDANHLGGQGLLGIDTLRDHKILIDLDAGTMSVSPSVKRIKQIAARSDEIVVRAKSLFGQLIVTDAKFDGKPIRVVLDTGSPISVGNEAMRRLVARRSGRLKPLRMTSATGGIVMTQYAIVDKVQLGDIEFQSLAVAFADVAPFKRFALDKRPAMFLGMDALRSFRRVGIDFANREVRFQMPRQSRATQRCRLSVGQGCAA